ncbi:MAG: DUF2383 domain-containing protein [Firmicutes bacterium]|nr:DUF2383 domain-containing protein [Bacillota bacterium]
MAIKSYEHFLQQVDDEQIKKTLQKIQQEHKIHALKIAEQIQNLGGRPIDEPTTNGRINAEAKKLTPKRSYFYTQGCLCR